MKKFIISAAIILPLLLGGCTADSECDINELLPLLNERGGYSLSTDKFTVTKGEKYCYSAFINEHTLLCIYADENGVISRCTVTTDRGFSNSYMKLCGDAAAVICSSGEDIMQAVTKQGRWKSNVWQAILLESEAGKTFLINRISDPMNTNGKPTLKREIRKEDISRPTAAAETTAKTSK